MTLTSCVTLFTSQSSNRLSLCRAPQSSLWSLHPLPQCLPRVLFTPSLPRDPGSRGQDVGDQSATACMMAEGRQACRTHPTRDAHDVRHSATALSSCQSMLQDQVPASAGSAADVVQGLDCQLHEKILFLRARAVRRSASFPFPFSNHSIAQSIR